MNSARAARLAVVRAVGEGSQREVDLAPGVFARAKSHSSGGYMKLVPSRAFVGKVGEHELHLTIRVSDRAYCVAVPYGLVREAWITTDRRVALYLGARLMLEGDRLVFGD